LGLPEVSALASKVGRSSDPLESEAADVALAAAGDGTAFERLYRRHVARINSLAEWMLGTPDTEDVLQDIFIRAWEKLGTFRGQSAFGTWLHRLAVNVLLRRRETDRVRARRYIAHEETLEQAEAPATGPQLWADIETAVERLPQRSRDVFVLHDVVGYKHDEIAEHLGITAGTSRSQLHHARMTLRKHFE
jgi:RNA polymerase sigma-70 factor (ECF subfamily)